MAEFIDRIYSETAFATVETPPLGDQRSQNLGLPGKRDTVFEAGSE